MASPVTASGAMASSTALPVLGMVGLSHREAPVQTLERLAFPGERLTQALHAWAHGGRKGVILFTCNRVELYFSGARDLSAEAADFLSTFHGVPAEELRPLLLVRQGEAAARHLLRVAAGLDSMVVGETEVLGQVRQAYHAALGAAYAGPILAALFRKALEAGRRVRRETALGRRPVSMGSAAVRLLERVHGPLGGAAVLLVGTGELAELVGRQLQAAGARLVVASRTRGRAEELAGSLGGRPAGREDLAAELAQAEVVVAATSAHHYVLTPAMLDGWQPLVILDMALPRNVDPRLGGLPRVTLLDIDDLRGVLGAQLVAGEQGLVQAEGVTQAEGVVQAEAMIEEEARLFSVWMRTRRVAPVISSLRRRAEAIRQRELEKALARLPAMDEGQREVVAAMSRAIVKKLLHEPIVRLKGEAALGNGEAAVAALEELFGLESGDDGAPAETGGNGHA